MRCWKGSPGLWRLMKLGVRVSRSIVDNPPGPHELCSWLSQAARLAGSSLVDVPAYKGSLAEAKRCVWLKPTKS
eukprot:370748-Pelagomonas_calceolata.AAC.1